MSIQHTAVCLPYKLPLLRESSSTKENVRKWTHGDEENKKASRRGRGKGWRKKCKQTGLSLPNQKSSLRHQVTSECMPDCPTSQKSFMHPCAGLPQDT